MVFNVIPRRFESALSPMAVAITNARERPLIATVGATQVAIVRWGGEERGRGGKAVIATCVAPTGNRRASGGAVGATQVAMGRRTAGLQGVLWERRKSRSGGEPPRLGGRCGSDASRDGAENRGASGGVVGATRVAMGRCGGEERGRGGKAVIATCVAPTKTFAHPCVARAPAGATQVVIAPMSRAPRLRRSCAAGRQRSGPQGRAC